MKKIPILLLFLGLAAPGIAQSVTLQECYEKAAAHYPLRQERALLAQQAEVKLERIQTERLPQVSWNAQASLQTETIAFPFDLPGGLSIDLPLYRIQTTADLQYLILDGGRNDARQEMERAGLSAELQEVEVALYPLRQQVNQYILGVLLLREQAGILEESKKSARQKAQSLQAAVRHGVALPADVDKLQVEILRLQSRIEQAEGDARGLIAALSSLIGEPLPADVAFELPGLSGFRIDSSLQRPELALFDLQKERLLAQESIIAASRKPVLSAFLQAGVGAPNPLNFFDEKLSPFAMGGLKFSWTIFDWKQSSRDRQLLSLNSQLVDTKRATFIANVNRINGKYREEIATLEARLARDAEIIALQERILAEVSAQVEQGVATTTDYITQLHALQQARLDQKVVELQLINTKLDYLTQKGL